MLKNCLQSMRNSEKSCFLKQKFESPKFVSYASQWCGIGSEVVLRSHNFNFNHTLRRVGRGKPTPCKTSPSGRSFFSEIFYVLKNCWRASKHGFKTSCFLTKWKFCNWINLRLIKTWKSAFCPSFERPETNLILLDR